MSIVKVSAKSARALFHGCDPEYVRNVCHGSCCRSSASPEGTIVYVAPHERAGVESHGGRIRPDGLLITNNKRCPFQNSDDLCDLHGTGAKPLNCIASPFTLTPNGTTLVISYRYRLLNCHKRDGTIPAYVSFRASLLGLFGLDETDRITRHLDAGGGDIMATLLPGVHSQLMARRDVRKTYTR